MTSRPAGVSALGVGVPWRDFFFLMSGGIGALRPLAVFWQGDPDYAFGWGVPLLAGYLFFARWRDRPAGKPYGGSAVGLISILVPWAAAFLLTRMVVETVPDWRPGLWFVASLYVGAVAAWCRLYGGGAWGRHFGWAIGFLLCGVPWLYHLEEPVVQGLMRWNAARVADSLVLADIPARAAGNTLVLATGQLGVEAACSGIRSLQAALTMALFLGEFYRFSGRRRALLLLLALALALGGNYFRLLGLAWRGAHSGISAVAASHDLAGGMILAFTILGLWICCLALRKKRGKERQTEPIRRTRSAQENCRATRWATGILIAVLAGEVLTQSWFAWREAAAINAATWTVRWPQEMADYRPIPIPAATHELLGDVRSAAGTWRDERGWRWRVMWFDYPPQAANRMAFDLHNPEVCLPAAGFRKTADYGEFPCSLSTGAWPVQGYLFSAGDESGYVFWMARLGRETEREPDFRRGQLVYGGTWTAIRERISLWLGEAARGVRKMKSETLEVTITGAPNYGAARRAFVAFAESSIVEETPGNAPPSSP